MSKIASKIHYLEKPITQEEKEVAELLQKFLYSASRKNFDEFRSLFSKDARIADIAAGFADEKIISVEQYIENLAKVSQNYFKVNYKDVLIRVINKKKAVIGLTACIISAKDDLKKILNRYLRLKKLGQSWFIVEIGWQ